MRWISGYLCAVFCLLGGVALAQQPDDRSFAARLDAPITIETPSENADRIVDMIREKSQLEIELSPSLAIEGITK